MWRIGANATSNQASAAAGVHHGNDEGASRRGDGHDAGYLWTPQEEHEGFIQGKRQPSR